MRRISPLGDRIGQPGQVLGLAERAFLGHIVLRGHGADAAFVAAVQSALGVAPPLRPNTLASTPAGAADAVTVIWMAPDEWHVQTPPEQRDGKMVRLRTALAGQFAAVTDISDGLTVVVLDAPFAADLLSRGCPLDLHPAVFPVGACAQSVFGKTGVLMVRESAERFAIFVRRSFAGYLYQALQHAAALAAPPARGR